MSGITGVLCAYPITVAFVGALVSQLVGCSSVEKEQAYFTKARESCKKYGFVENTDAFAQCMQNDVNAAKNREAIEDAAIIRSMKK